MRARRWVPIAVVGTVVLAGCSDSPRDGTGGGAADGDGDRGSSIADIAKAELVIEGDIVIGGEVIGSGEAFRGETHELDKALDLTGDIIGFAQSGDDGDVIGALDLDRTSIHPSIVDTLTGSWCQIVVSLVHSTDRDGDARGGLRDSIDFTTRERQTG